MNAVFLTGGTCWFSSKSPLLTIFTIPVESQIITQFDSIESPIHIRDTQSMEYDSGEDRVLGLG